MKGKTPDVTLVQILAMVQMAVGQLVAWGWVSNDRAQVIISVGTIVLAVAWQFADAHLRGKRALAFAAAGRELLHDFEQVRGEVGQVSTEGSKTVVREDTAAGADPEGAHPAG